MNGLYLSVLKYVSLRVYDSHFKLNRLLEMPELLANLGLQKFGVFFSFDEIRSEQYFLNETWKLGFKHGL